MRGTLKILLFTLFFVSPLNTQDLFDAKMRDLLHEVLSGELAKEHVIQITRHHRIQGSRGYRNAANYVLTQLRSYGFSEKDAYIESFVSDGKVKYQTWQSPSGWDISWGELRMLEPFEERIVGYPEIAMSVITYSNAGDETAELVWVGAGTSDTDYAGKDVADKFVLATGYGGAVHRLAVLKYGAKAVVCYLDDDRAKEYPDMLQYTGMWPKTEELERVTFGFNLTNRQGEKLRKLLEEGRKVVLRGQVKGIGLEPYFMDVVVAHVRGSERPEEELVFTAHLDHPKESANDNASGSAALLDIARALQESIADGRLPRPKRSLRFLWVPEFYGTMAYIDAHPEMRGVERGGTFLATMNMDMVGENLEVLHSKLVLTRTPPSNPSVVNDVVENMAKMVDMMNIRTPRGSLSQFNYRVTEYHGGSDHMMFNDLKIPGIMFFHDPDYTHHTSEDTPDKVDPVELERCEMIATGTVLYLANLSSEQARDLLYYSAAASAKRLGDAAYRAQRILHSSPNAMKGWSEAQNVLDQALAVEQKSIASVLSFNAGEGVRRLAALLQRQLVLQHETLTQSLGTLAVARGVRAPRPAPLESRPDVRVPVRLTRGPLSSDVLTSTLPPEGLAWYRTEGSKLTGMHQWEIVNMMDGRRSVSEIRNFVSAYYGAIETAFVARYVEDLVKAGVVKWK